MGNSLLFVPTVINDSDVDISITENPEKKQIKYLPKTTIEKVRENATVTNKKTWKGESTEWTFFSVEKEGIIECIQSSLMI